MTDDEIMAAIRAHLQGAIAAGAPMSEDLMALSNYQLNAIAVILDLPFRVEEG